MEFRYVYRRLEDSIGAPLDIEDSPHAVLTRKLRFDMREARDLGRRNELVALCMAGMAGNDGIDIAKITGRILDFLDRALARNMPYLRVPLHDSETESDSSDAYAEYFALLDEMEKHRKEKAGEAEKAGSP